MRAAFAIAQVWSLKDLISPQSLVGDVESFPGPASSAPQDKLKEYVEGRAGGGEGREGLGREGERLLWGIAGVALQFKVRRPSYSTLHAWFIFSRSLLLVLVNLQDYPMTV